jgi:hypothetical protein
VQKFLTTVAVLTAIATPAFAQPLDPDNQAGDVLSFGAKQTAPQNDKITVRQRGIRAYGMVPGISSAHVTHHKEGAAYNGNWGFAPGNGDDEWGRSHGFWDTNAPGCPLKFCS